MTDSILRSYQAYSYTSLVPFPAAAAEVIEGADLFLEDETDGLAFDARTYSSITPAAYVGGPVGGLVSVKDTGTPANTVSNITTDNSAFVQSGTSPKLLYFPTAPFARWTPHNYHLASQDFSTSWNNNNATVTNNSVVAPDGTTTATNFTMAASNGIIFCGTNRDISLSAGVAYTFSVFAKYNNRQFLQVFIERADFSNGINVYFDVQNGVVGSQATDAGTLSYITHRITSAGGGWYRCEVVVSNSTDFAYGFGFVAMPVDGGPATTGGQVELYGAHMNRGYIATPYLATTSSERFGIPIGYDTVAGTYGVLIETAMTNICLYSDDLTNAAWTKTNMTTAFTANGADDRPNSATTCTATAGNATALQAITSSSAWRTTSVWLKRRTGSGNIDITQDNGSTWTTVAVTSAWTRVFTAAASLTDPTIGIRIVTSGDAVDVWGFHHESGGFISAIPTSTIPTLGASQTRARDDIKMAGTAFPIGATANTQHCLARSNNNNNSGTFSVGLALHGAATGETNCAWQLYEAPNLSLRVRDAGGSAIAQPGRSSGIPAATDVVKYAWYCATNHFNSAFNSIVNTEDTTGTPPTFTSVKIADINSNTSGVLACTWVYYAVLLPRTSDDTELDVLTT